MFSIINVAIDGSFKNHTLKVIFFVLIGVYSVYSVTVVFIVFRVGVYNNYSRCLWY